MNIHQLIYVLHSHLMEQFSLCVDENKGSWHLGIPPTNFEIDENVVEWLGKIKEVVE